MAATFDVSIIAELMGLDKDINFPEKFAVTTTPTKAMKGYQIQAVADTEEALNLGGITTIELIVIKCVSNDVDIDTSFNTAFSAEITVNEGEVAVFKPTGTVYIKNDDATEVSTVSYVIVGT